DKVLVAVFLEADDSPVLVRIAKEFGFEKPFFDEYLDNGGHGIIVWFGSGQLLDDVADKCPVQPPDNLNNLVLRAGELFHAFELYTETTNSLVCILIL